MCLCVYVFSGACNEVIKGPYVSALDQSWHPEHFACTTCQSPFDGNQFRKHDNKPYCDVHFNELFAPKCSQCGLTIDGQVFEALDQKYHLACFSCAADGKPIGEGVMFHVHENKIYCPEHFENLFLQKCAGCKEGRQITHTHTPRDLLHARTHYICCVCVRLRITIAHRSLTQPSCSVF